MIMTVVMFIVTAAAIVIMMSVRFIMAAAVSLFIMAVMTAMFVPTERDLRLGSAAAAAAFRMIKGISMNHRGSPYSLICSNP